MEKQYIVDESLLRVVLEYLIRRPFVEVADIINLVRTKPVPYEKPTDEAADNKSPDEQPVVL